MCRLALEPDQTIRTITETHAIVSDALASGGLELDCSAVADVDTSFLQLLASARRSANVSRQPFVVVFPPDGVVAHALRRLGLEADSVAVGEQQP